MPRTNAAAVQKIIDYDTTLIPDLTPFIADASTLLDAVVGSTTLAAGLAEVVERYLTAHLVGITDPRLQSEQVKTLQSSYQYKIDLGLNVTHWGQMAMVFDTSGKLANWNDRVVNGDTAAFSFFWAGTDREYSTEV